MCKKVFIGLFVFSLVLVASACGRSHVKPVGLGEGIGKSESTETTTEEARPIEQETQAWVNSVSMIQSVLANKDAKLDLSDSKNSAETLMEAFYESTLSEGQGGVFELIEVTKPVDEEGVLYFTDSQKTKWKVMIEVDNGNLVMDGCEKM
jgi:hypothetical protein